MTRASQDLFRHSIAANQSLTNPDTRISLTFRSLHWRNNNNTVIIGDSNTGGLKFSHFGKDAPSDRNGTFGNAMPGKRVAAFKVDQIDPITCIGFNNVVVHCGINNIRGGDISSEEQIKEVYVDLKTKISDITKLNKRARVYVSTILPTKCEDDNRKVKIFNSMLINDLTRSFKDVKIINHYSRFSNTSGILASNLSNEFNNQGEPDLLHLNVTGLRLFSFLIKNALFSYKKSHERGAGGRSYSSVVSSTGRQGSFSDFRSDDSENPRRGGRRGGYNNHRRRPRR